MWQIYIRVAKCPETVCCEMSVRGACAEALCRFARSAGVGNPPRSRLGPTTNMKYRTSRTPRAWYMALVTAVFKQFRHMFYNSFDVTFCISTVSDIGYYSHYLFNIYFLIKTDMGNVFNIIIKIYPLIYQLIQTLLFTAFWKDRRVNLSKWGYFKYIYN